MKQFRHLEDSDRGESSNGDNSAASPCTVLDLPFVVPVVFPPESSEAVPPQPHIVLSCSAYDDDCEE